jgi:hypothetical protein
MKISENTLYDIVSSIGTFSDELAFKKAFLKIINSDKENYKKAFAIENTVEPGMPDVITINKNNEVFFIETKYARKGVITFKRSQIPWYKRNSDLEIFILAYNDLTRSIHIINALGIRTLSSSVRYKLVKEQV